MYALQQRRYWDYPLGPVSGLAGTSTTITVTPQCAYRVEKVMASDDGPVPGMSTAVMQFLVGQRLQRPASAGSAVALFFGPMSLGNGVCWDTCPGGFQISLTISFLQTATFFGALFGSGVV